LVRLDEQRSTVTPGVIPVSTSVHQRHVTRWLQFDESGTNAAHEFGTWEKRAGDATHFW
jgi:hypothetical protein